MDECNIIRLNNLISYISPTENPLSANVVMIQGREALWLYDVGNHPDIPQVIEQFRDGRNVNVILSHFHEDHIGNLPGMGVDEVYQGKYTHRHTGMGTVVEDDIYIQDGEDFIYFHCRQAMQRAVLRWKLMTSGAFLEMHCTLCRNADITYTMQAY